MAHAASDIASAVEFLLGEGASFITGCDLRVDGIASLLSKMSLIGSPMLRRFLDILAAATVILAGLFIAFILVPGRRAPQGNPEYVALGSSFAAGLGLGPRVEGSAVAAGRTVDSYPQKFARLSGLSLVDMTWSGSRSRDSLHSGVFFQRPQIDGVGPQTRLVTITAGGNDVAYDHRTAACRPTGSAFKFSTSDFPVPGADK